MKNIRLLILSVLIVGCKKTPPTSKESHPPTWHLYPPDRCASGSAEITFDDVGIAKERATNNARGNLAGNGNHTVINGYAQQAAVVDGTIYILMCLGEE